MTPCAAARSRWQRWRQTHDPALAAGVAAGVACGGFVIKEVWSMFKPRAMRAVAAQPTARQKFQHQRSRNEDLVFGCGLAGSFVFVTRRLFWHGHLSHLLRQSQRQQLYHSPNWQHHVYQRPQRPHRQQLESNQLGSRKYYLSQRNGSQWPKLARHLAACG